MSITERLANLNLVTVIAIIVILVFIRFILLKQRFVLARTLAEIAESLALALGLVFLLIRPFLIQAFFIPSESMVPTLLISDHIIVNKLVYHFKEPKLGDVIVFKSPKEAGHDEVDYIKRVIGVSGDEVRITPGYVIVRGVPYYHQDLRSEFSHLSPNEDECMAKLTDGKLLIDGKLVKTSDIATAFDSPNAPVQIIPGKVYVNGKTLSEEYTAEDADTSYPDSNTPRKWISINEDGQQIVKIPEGKLLVMGDNRNFSDDARRWGLLDRSRVKGKAMFIFYPFGRLGLVR